MTTADVLARGEELRQQGETDGGGLWAMAEYVDWLVGHGETLMQMARVLDDLIAEDGCIYRRGHQEFCDHRTLAGRDALRSLRDTP